MFRFSLLCATLIITGTALPAAAACSGADPAITAASAKPIAPNGDLNNVRASITVQNRGSAGQPSNTLQSVEIYQNQTKVGMKGVPPLAAGKSYTFTYAFQRSSEAPAGTTPLTLKLVVKQPAGVDCDASNDSYHLKV